MLAVATHNIGLLFMMIPKGSPIIEPANKENNISIKIFDVIGENPKLINIEGLICTANKATIIQ